MLGAGTIAKVQISNSKIKWAKPVADGREWIFLETKGFRNIKRGSRINR